MNETSLESLIERAESLKYKHVAEANELYSLAVDCARKENNLLREVDALLGKAFTSILSSQFEESIISLDEVLKRLDRFPETELQAVRKGRAQVARLKGLYYENIGDLNKAIESHHYALAEFNELRDATSQAVALNSLATAYGRIGLYPESLTYYLRGEKAYQDIGDPEGEAFSKMGAGIIYGRLGDYEASLACSFNALRQFEALNNKYNAAKTLSNIASLYLDLGNEQEALECYQRVTLIYEALSDNTRLATAYSNLAEVYAHLGDDEKARTHALMTLALESQFANRDAKTSALHTLGRVQGKGQQWNEAFSSLFEARTLAQSANDKNGEIQILIAIGSVLELLLASGVTELRKIEGFDTPAEAYGLAKQLAEEIGEKKYHSDAAKRLAGYYETKGDHRQALNAIKEHFEIETELRNRDREKSLSLLKIKFDIEQARREAELERQKNAQLALALAQAQEANRIKTEVLHVVAHDLQTPVGTLSNLAYLLRRRAEGNEKIGQLIERMERISAQMRTQIENLLITGDNRFDIELNLERLSPVALLNEVRLFMDLSSKRLMITTHFSTDAETFSLYGDTKSLVKLFENLLSNAAKYSHPDSTITLKADVVLREDVSALTSTPLEALWNEKQWIRMSIRDEGLGFSEEDLREAFGKFKRLSSKPTAGESSTGLGLYIAKSITEKHHGLVQLESAGKNKGTTVYLYFPGSLPNE